MSAKDQITNFRVLKNRALYKANMVVIPFGGPTTKYPMKTHYRKRITYTREFATAHKLGDWGEWVEIPFLFIPVRDVDGKWVWGRNVYVQSKPHGVDFMNETIDAEMRFDRKKNIFMRKLRGTDVNVR